MTARSIRRAQERKAKKAALKSQKLSALAQSAVVAETLPACESVESQSAELESPEYSELPQPTPSLAISPAKLAANRANAQLSSGPRTAAGKAKASLNAVKSGLTGRTVLLAGDDAAEYERHLRSFEEEYAPIGQRESDLVQSIADTWWRLRRIPCLESALFAQGYVEFSDQFEEHDLSLRPALIQAQAFLKYEKQIRNLHLQESRLFRRYEKDRAELRQLQQERKETQMQALEAASNLYLAAKQQNQSFDPAEYGFEFSTAEIDHHLHALRARETARSTPNRTPNRIKMNTQAA